MTHQEIKDQLPLYVLGGLDAETVAAVEQHLAESCDSCAMELREWQEVVGFIPLGVTQAGPDVIVKERLMSRVRQDRGAKVVSLRSRRWRMVWTTVPLAAAATLALLFVRDLYHDARRYRDSVKHYTEQALRLETVETLLAQEKEKLAGRESEIQQLTAQLTEQQAAVVEKTQLVAQLETTLAQRQTALAEQQKLVSASQQELAQLRNANSGQQARVAAYESEITTLKADLERQRDLVANSERELTELRATLEQQKSLAEASAQETEQLRAAVGRQRGVIEVLTSPGLRIGYLRRAKLGVSTQGHVLWNEQKKAWLFYSFNMPQPPPGKEYQVWFMTEREGPVSAGLFTPDNVGTGVVLAEPPSKFFGRIVATAVTLEPAGGLPKPSGEMYLRGSL